MPGLNPFILKAKKKLVEGFALGDMVEITWDCPNFPNNTVMTGRGKISELTDWICLDGSPKPPPLPLTTLLTIRHV